MKPVNQGDQITFLKSWTLSKKEDKGISNLKREHFKTGSIFGKFKKIKNFKITWHCFN